MLKRRGLCLIFCLRQVSRDKLAILGWIDRGDTLQSERPRTIAGHINARCNARFAPPRALVASGAGRRFDPAAKSGPEPAGYTF
jgi:hypothetical protein